MIILIIREFSIHFILGSFNKRINLGLMCCGFILCSLLGAGYKAF